VGLNLVGGRERWFRCLPAALRWSVTTYDALYLLLAEDVGAVLVTADRRLAHSGLAHGLPVRHVSTRR